MNNIICTAYDLIEQIYADNYYNIDNIKNIELNDFEKYVVYRKIWSETYNPAFYIHKRQYDLNLYVNYPCVYKHYKFQEDLNTCENTIDYINNVKDISEFHRICALLQTGKKWHLLKQRNDFNFRQNKFIEFIDTMRNYKTPIDDQALFTLESIAFEIYDDTFIKYPTLYSTLFRRFWFIKKLYLISKNYLNKRCIYANQYVLTYLRSFLHDIRYLNDQLYNVYSFTYDTISIYCNNCDLTQIASIYESRKTLFAKTLDPHILVDMLICLKHMNKDKDIAILIADNYDVILKLKMKENKLNTHILIICEHIIHNNNLRLFADFINDINKYSAQIRKHTFYAHYVNQTNSCIICYDDILNNQKCIKCICCNQIIGHFNCIQRLRNRNIRCPLCRTNGSIIDIKQLKYKYNDGTCKICKLEI